LLDSGKPGPYAFAMSEALHQSFREKSEGREGPARLAKLRGVLTQRSLDGWLVARADEHQNEYLPASEERLAWLTGFTGSAGFAVVLMDQAAVFTDGRYTEQLLLQTERGAFAAVSMVDDPPSAWLKRHAKPGMRIGYDPRRHTPQGLKRFRETAQAGGFALVPSEPNAVDAVWEERPAAPTAPISLHPPPLAGKSAAAKLSELQAQIAADRHAGLVITDPTGIAWLFNIRGGDVAHMPLPIGYAVVPAEGKPTLFLDGRKLSNSVRAALADIADILEPQALEPHLDALAGGKARLLFDQESASAALIDRYTQQGGLAEVGVNPIQLRKAVKNAAEQDGARDAQLRDGAAMVEFLRWFDAEAPQGRLTEIDAAVALEGFRRATGKLKDISFDTISAAGPNAALPHYRVNERSNRRIGKGIFLIDSGGQYLDGTTDVTRTLAVGAPTAEMMRRNTLVLKGMVAVSRVAFPKGISGAQLDTLARQFLWAEGLEFDHGTGHGVGSYLGVHEGPQRISKLGTTPLEPGMILSNEPGYYKPGRYGIRIENLLMVEKREIKGAEREMLGFETLTLCPIDRRLIDRKLLTADETKWLDAYHARVLKALSPLVGKDTKAWLKAACAPL
jgi:Xaa-Pro aminopeptidase